MDLTRSRIGIRCLYSLLFFFIHEIVKTLVAVTTVFQCVYLLITREPCEPVRRFANQLSTYAYRTLRYLTFNETDRPFPFREFPPELEPPAAEITL